MNEWKKGRFIWNDDKKLWVCTGCGFLMTDDTMRFLYKPICPFCDKPTFDELQKSIKEDKENAKAQWLYMSIEELIDYEG